MYNSKLSNITQKWVDILKPFTNSYNNDYSSSNLSKLTNIPQQTISRVLNELIQINLLNYKINGKNKEFYFNLDSIQSKSLISIIEEKKSIDFLQSNTSLISLFEDISKYCDSFILFGSYASNKFDSNSDIDLIILEGNVDKLKIIKQICPIELNFEFISYSELENYFNGKNPLITEIKLNHIFFGNSSNLVKLFIKNGK